MTTLDFAKKLVKPVNPEDIQELLDDFISEHPSYDDKAELEEDAEELVSDIARVLGFKINYNNDKSLNLESKVIKFLEKHYGLRE